MISAYSKIGFLASVLLWVFNSYVTGMDFGQHDDPHLPDEPNTEGFTCEKVECANKSLPCVVSSETCSVQNGLKMACYALWSNTTREGLKVSLKGCWHSQPEMKLCNPDRCVTDKLQSSMEAGAETYFCCCESSNCNEKFYFEHKAVTEIPLTGVSTLLPGDDNDLFTGIILTFVPICILAVLILMGYWIWRRCQLQKKFCQAQSTDPPPATRPPLPPIDWSSKALISRGRYGAVYKATMGNKLVAVKVFPPLDVESWTQEQDIYQVPALRNHDNILRYMGADVWGCGPSAEYLLITEFHENGSLYDYIKAHIVTYREMLHISVSMLRGLAFLHEETIVQGDRCYKPTIVHRDFKSRNVLLKKDLTACVADFGLALKCEHGRTPKETHGQVGTRRYMAPEVLEGATEFSAFAFRQIDVYASALVLWEVLSRCAIGNGPIDEYKLPFEEEVGSKPTLSEMQHVVVTQRRRPALKEAWLAHPKVAIVCQTIQEMWDNEFEARVTAGTALERFVSLEPSMFSNSYSLSSLSSNDKFVESTPLITDFANNPSVV